MRKAGEDTTWATGAPSHQGPAEKSFGSQLRILPLEDANPVSYLPLVERGPTQGGHKLYTQVCMNGA